MSKRLKVKLGDIVDSCLGKMLDAEKNRGDYQPYLANVNVRWGDFDLSNLSSMKFESSEAERYGIKNGDLIICEGGEPGRCAIWREQMPNMKIQKALHRVRAKNGLDIRYLYYWLLFAGKTGRLERYFTGSTIKHLPGDSLSEIEIELPSINNQKSVSTILDSIDRKIALNNAINTELEKAAKLLYDYWFVQFDFPNAEGKPYRVSGGKMVYNEQLKRETPKGWQVVAFNEIVKENRQPLPDDMDKTGLPGLDLSIMPGNTMCLNQRGNADDFDSNRFRLSKYDLLFGSIRPYLRKAGFSSFDGVVNGTIINLRCKNKQDYSFALCTLTGDGLFQYADTRSRGNGTRMPTINAGELMGYTVTYDKKIAFAFNNQVSRYWEMIASNINQNFELTALRDFLLPLLMNGQVTVAAGEQ